MMMTNLAGVPGSIDWRKKQYNDNDDDDDD